LSAQKIYLFKEILDIWKTRHSRKNVVQGKVLSKEKYCSRSLLPEEDYCPESFYFPEKLVVQESLISEQIYHPSSLETWLSC